MVIEQTGGTLTLGSGEPTSSARIEIRSDISNIVETEGVPFSIKTYRGVTEQTDRIEAGGLLVSGAKMKGNIYEVPAADLAQVVSDGHYGVIGENHPTRILDRLEAITGVAKANFNIVSY